MRMAIYGQHLGAVGRVTPPSRRGVSGLGTSTDQIMTQPGTPTPTTNYTAYCNTASWWNPINWAVCFPHDVSTVASDLVGVNSVASLPDGTALPAPAPPSIALVTGATTDPNAVYAGADSSGNPIYAIPQSADENMDQYRADVQAYLQQLSDANTEQNMNWVRIGLAVAVGAIVVIKLSK